MILYPSAYGGLPVLLTCFGSVLPRVIVPALFSAALTTVIELNVSHKYLTDSIPADFPYQVFTTIVSFLLVFRVNHSYGRYWEACGTVQEFGCKYGDAVAEAMTDDIVWTKSQCHPEANKDMEYELFRGQLAHLSSLQHALTLAHLRGQKEHGRHGHHGLHFKATPDGKTHDSYIQAESPGSGCAELFRAWCRTWSGQRGYQAFLKEHPLYVLGGVSDAEVAMLQPLSSFQRISQCHSHLLALFQARRSVGGMMAAEGARSAASFARLGNYLSMGNTAFYQALKILDTPLPFAYQQICSLALSLFVVTFPVVSVSRFGGDVGDAVAWLPPIASFMSTLMFYSLYEVSREMEEPFLNPPNAIPLLMAQNAFNCRVHASATRLGQLAAEVAEGTAQKGLLGVHREHEDDPATLLTRTWQAARTGAASTHTDWEPNEASQAAAYARTLAIDKKGLAGGASVSSVRESRQRLTSAPRIKMRRQKTTAQVVQTLTHNKSMCSSFQMAHVP